MNSLKKSLRDAQVAENRESECVPGWGFLLLGGEVLIEGNDEFIRIDAVHLAGLR